MTNKKISTTIEEYLNNIKDTITVNNFRAKDFDDCLLTDLLPQYIDCVSVVFNELELRKYQYNVKTLSYDLYGTVDLAFLICDLNDCKNLFEFKIDKELNLPSNQMIQNLTTLYHNIEK